MADAAYEIQKKRNSVKTIEVTTANADIAKQEREIELKQKEVAVKEQALEAEVKKAGGSRQICSTAESRCGTLSETERSRGKTV